MLAANDGLIFTFAATPALAGVNKYRPFTCKNQPGWASIYDDEYHYPQRIPGFFQIKRT